MSPLIMEEVDAVLPASPAAPSSATWLPYPTPRGRPGSRPTSRRAQSSRACSPLPGTHGILSSRTARAEGARRRSKWTGDRATVLGQHGCRPARAPSSARTEHRHPGCPARRNQARLRCGAGEDRRADAGRFTGRHRGAGGVGRHVEHLHEVAAGDEQGDVAVPLGDHLSANNASRPVISRFDRGVPRDSRLQPPSSGDNSKKRGTRRGTGPARGRRVSTAPFGMIEISPRTGACPRPAASARCLARPA